MEEVQWYCWPTKVEVKMYCLINNETLEAWAVSPCFHALCLLAYLELETKAWEVFPLDDATQLTKYTDSELKLIYRNLSKQGANLNRGQLLQVLFDMLLAAKTQKLNVSQLERQIQYRDAANAPEAMWSYVADSNVPARAQESITGGLICPVLPIVEQSAKDGALPALKRKKSPSVTFEACKKPENKAPKQPKEGGSSKAGTKKAIIWEVADELWESAGKPTDKKLVLALRLEIMATLTEQHGMSRNSTSCALGKWHLARAPY